jgi:periplasmic protein TonB
MKRQTQSFGISLLLHLVAVSGVFAAGAYIPQTRTVALDFSLDRFSTSPAAPVTARASSPPAPLPREERIVTPTEKNEEAVPIRKSVEEETPPPTPPAVIASVPEAAKSAADISGSRETAQAGYISAQFSRIRDRILKNISYPPTARRMGWTGRVVVSFIVYEDGHVEDIIIKESSGFTVLDENAIRAVRESCPLPMPPVRTALVMPVLYRLE